MFIHCAALQNLYCADECWLMDVAGGDGGNEGDADE